MRYLILILILSGCTANYHLNKAIKKGAKLKTIEVVKHDTTYFSDHYYQVDTVFNNEVLVEYVPKTRWETRIEYRYDYKRFKDSLRHFRKVYSDSLQVHKKLSLKALKNERNKANRLNRILGWGMFFFLLILICYIGLRILATKLFK